MLFRLCVCLFARKLLLGKRRKGYILGMDRSGIYRGRTTLKLEVHPTNRSDAVVRNADTCREKMSKIVVF